MIPHSHQRVELLHRLLCSEAPKFYFSLSFFCVAALCLTSKALGGSSFTLHRHKGHGSLIRNGEGPVSLDCLVRTRQRDEARHSRLLAAASANPDRFPLGGIADPNFAGLYFTEIELGTPPTKYYVQVDTGSDLLWVNCASCKTCPTSTQLGVRLALYDPGSSLTSTNVLCGDAYCDIASSGGCQTADLCGYQLGYGDGSSSQGYFVRDALQLNFVVGNKSTTTNASVAFGCGISQGGELQNSDQALDGIIGFGQSNLSIFSQLVNQKKAPGVFAHCLNGEGDGGGILVIGEVYTSGLVYTPILQNQPHYNVNLKSISVNGVNIPIDSSVSQNGGTIIDSGTTLAYFTDMSYQELVQAVCHMYKKWSGFSFNNIMSLQHPDVVFVFEDSQSGKFDSISFARNDLLTLHGQVITDIR